MFFGLSHVDVPVSNLDRARQLYVSALGFPILSEGEGFVDLDAATAKVRLLQSSNVQRPASLRVEAGDVEAGLKLLQQSGGRVLYEAERTDQLTLEGTVQDADGNTITVWRALTEDEYGFVPELPKQGGWTQEAEDLVKSVLLSVPALFRGLARRKVVKEAERRAGVDGCIDRDLAIRALIAAQSPPTRSRIRKPLEAHGVDLAQYEDEFAA